MSKSAGSTGSALDPTSEYSSDWLSSSVELEEALAAKSSTGCSSVIFSSIVVSSVVSAVAADQDVED